MKKNQFGNISISIFVFLNIVLWLIAPPENTLDTNHTLQFVGEVIASTVMILFSITLILSARPRILEPYFGGLDKMWRTHKNISVLAFLLVIIHFFSIPKTSELINGKPIGMLSFLGIVVLVLITIAPRIPLLSRLLNFNYTRWRIAHKLLGVFFILGLVHYMTVETISKMTVPGTYMLLFSFAGILAYIYRQFFSRMFEPYKPYIVEEVKRLNGQVVDVSLKASKKKIGYSAGQFAYVSFNPGRELREPHPFTISSSPKDQSLRFTIKSSGDWTNHLVKNLEAGMKAAVHGGFGTFNYKDGGDNQVWIAGGIGITPFLSWVRDFENNPDQNIDLFYSVRSQDDALFLDELQKVAETYPNFRIHLQRSSKDGNLTTEDIIRISDRHPEDIDIYMCGPIAMTEGFARAFKALSVSPSKIHYEEFNFR